MRTEGVFTFSDTVISVPDIQKPFRYMKRDALRLKPGLTAASETLFQLFLDELHEPSAVDAFAFAWAKHLLAAAFCTG